MLLRQCKGRVSMSVSVLLAYIVAVVVLIATPGPVVALIMNVAARYGVRYALITVLGANLASLVLLTSAALIISGVVALHEYWLNWVSLIGCGFIGWMAFNNLRAELRNKTATARTPDSSLAPKRHSGFFNGFLLGVSNPKDIIFFVAFFPQFIAVTPNLKLSLGVLTLVWMLADFVILMSYALLVRGRLFQRHARKISLLDRKSTRL